MFARVAPVRQARRPQSRTGTVSRPICGRLPFAAFLAAALIGGAAKAADPAPDPLRAVVGIHTQIPPHARTAGSLGTDREGSGVVIDNNGLVLTIGYLVMEARSAELYTPDNRKIPAAVVAYDHTSGFGLLRASLPLGLPAIELGTSTGMEAGAKVLAVSFGGPHPVMAQQIVSRRAFAGYWEYLLDSAIFTMPPQPQFGGAALIAADGKLVGVGSLFVNDAILPDTFGPGNMFVPIDVLKPILNDLVKAGRQTGPARPWLGVHTIDARGRVVVVRTNDDGPAKAAGIAAGDVIVAVGGERVATVEDFLRKTWALGAAGTEVPLDVVKGDGDPDAVRHVKVRSIDRLHWLRIDRGL